MNEIEGDRKMGKMAVGFKCGCRIMSDCPTHHPMLMKNRGKPGLTKKVRLVRYACDCAERVISKTGEFRPEAEAAIAAARAWCDRPTKEREKAVCRASDAAYDGVRSAAVYNNYAAYALYAAYSAAYFFNTKDFYTYAAATAKCAAEISNDYAAEIKWQAERRRFYGLDGQL